MTNRSDNIPTLVIVEQYISIYGPFILTTLGIVGNILSILIFLSPRYRRQSSHFYLLSLALSDLCFLIINFFEDTFRNHNQLYNSHVNFLDRSSSLICIVVQYARNVTRLLSSWIIVSFTIERLFVVFYPLKRAIICRRKIARYVVIVVFILSLLSNINVPFHYGIIKLLDRNDTICDIIPDFRTVYMRFAIITMISVYLLPMCIISVVNMLICCKLWRKSLLMEKDDATKIKENYQRKNSSYLSEFLSCLHLSPRSSPSLGPKQSQHGRGSSISQYQSIGPLLNREIQINGNIIHDQNQRQSRSQSRSRSQSHSFSNMSGNYSIQPKQSVCSVKTYIQSRTHRVTATLLLVSCSFLLLNIPYCIVWIANYVNKFDKPTLRSLKEITELFMLTNFCINFLLYCVSGKVFRSELICLLRCRWKELYERNDGGERLAYRKSRPKIEIQLNEMKLKPRSYSLYPNEQQHRLSVSSYTHKFPLYS